MAEPLSADLRVLAAAVVPRRRTAVLRMVAFVAECGGEAILVTAGELRPPPGVTYINLSPVEQRVGINRLLSASPSRLIRRVLGRPPAGGPSSLWRRWSRSRPYGAIRPWILWRALKRYQKELRLTDVTDVITVGTESWPIAWHIARLSPDVRVSYSLPAKVMAEVDRTMGPLSRET